MVWSNPLKNNWESPKPLLPVTVADGVNAIDSVRSRFAPPLSWISSAEIVDTAVGVALPAASCTTPVPITIISESEFGSGAKVTTSKTKTPSDSV